MANGGVSTVSDADRFDFHLDEGVQYWSDYSKVLAWPRSRIQEINLLSSYFIVPGVFV